MVKIWEKFLNGSIILSGITSGFYGRYKNTKLDPCYCLIRWKIKIGRFCLGIGSQTHNFLITF